MDGWLTGLKQHPYKVPGEIPSEFNSHPVYHFYDDVAKDETATSLEWILLINKQLAPLSWRETD